MFALGGGAITTLPMVKSSLPEGNCCLIIWSRLIPDSNAGVVTSLAKRAARAERMRQGPQSRQCVHVRVH